MLKEYLQSITVGAAPKVLDLSGFESELCSSSLPSLSAVLNSCHASEELLLSSTMLSVPEIVTLLSFVSRPSRCLKRLSLSFFVMELPSSDSQDVQMLCSAIEQLLRRTGKQIEALELYVECLGATDLFLPLLSDTSVLPVLRSLVLVTRIAPAGYKALQMLPRSLEKFWLGSLLINPEPKVSDVIVATVARLDRLKDVAVTLCPCVPEDPNFCEQFGKALKGLPDLKRFTFFGGIQSLDETRAVLAPVIGGGRVKDCLLCSRYFQVEAFETANADFSNLQHLSLVFGKDLTPEALDAVLKGVSRDLKTLVIDAENTRQNGLFSPERISLLASFPKLQRLAFRVETDPHILCYALHRFSSLKFLSINMCMWGKESKEFQLPPLLESLTLHECAPFGLAAVQAPGLSQLKGNLCLTGCSFSLDEIQLVVKTLLDANLNLELLELEVKDAKVALPTVEALFGSVQAKTLRVILDKKVKKAHKALIEQMFALCSQFPDRILDMGAGKTNGDLISVVVDAGKIVPSGFTSLLRALRNVPLPELEDEDMILEKFSSWLLFAKFGKAGKSGSACEVLSQECAMRVACRRAKVKAEQALQLALVALRFGLPKDLRRMLFTMVWNQK